MIMLIKSNIYYITFLIYNFFISFFSFIFSIKKDNLSIRNIIHYNKNHQIVGVYYDLWVAYTTLNNTDDYCEIFYYYNNSIYIIIVKNRENIIKYPPEGAYSDNNKILSAKLYPDNKDITNLLNQYSGHSKNFFLNTPFYLKYTNLPFLQNNQIISVIDNLGKKFTVSKNNIIFDPSDSDSSSDNDSLYESNNISHKISEIDPLIKKKI